MEKQGCERNEWVRELVGWRSIFQRRGRYTYRETFSGCSSRSCISSQIRQSPFPISRPPPPPPPPPPPLPPPPPPLRRRHRRSRACRQVRVVALRLAYRSMWHSRWAFRSQKRLKKVRTRLICRLVMIILRVRRRGERRRRRRVISKRERRKKKHRGRWNSISVSAREVSWFA